VGIPKHLEERLGRLEARVAALPDPEAERERMRRTELHFMTWATRGSFEDIPEADRDPEQWEYAVSFGPMFLGLIWEGFDPGREELLAAGVDFTLAAENTDYYAFREYGAPGPDTPRKL
jgi:hypothetical protein